jgi:integrase/recombinase XerD
MNKNHWDVTKDMFLKEEEIQKLYSLLEDVKDLALLRGRWYAYVRDYFIIRTLLETGLRVSELCDLKVGDFRGNSLIVQRGKGGKKRTIILTKQTQKLIAELVSLKKEKFNESVEPDAYLFFSEKKSRYNPRSIRRRVKLWFDECGFSGDLSCHSCRHTYVSNLIAEGVDLPTIRNNVGHSSLAITDLYSHATKDSLGDIELYGEKNKPGNKR